MSLSTTTLAQALTNDDNAVYLTSTSGIYPKTTFIAVDVEIMRVDAIGAGQIVKVLRGVEGTAAVAHASGSMVSIGTATDFTNAPVSAVIIGTTPDRTTTVVAQDSESPTAATTSTPIATVTS